MAADQERADRIRLLKQDNPQLKWRHIADHVGVELRSAQMWQETGAISYDNAKRLAALFEDVDVDWIMRGPRAIERAPSPFAGQDAVMDRLDAIDQRLARIEGMLVSGKTLTDQLDRLEGKLVAKTDALIPGVLDLLEEALTARAEAPKQTAGSET